MIVVLAVMVIVAVMFVTAVALALCLWIADVVMDLHDDYLEHRK